MGVDKTLTFGIRVQAESNAGEAANSVEGLRKRIEESQNAVRSYQQTLRQLRGTTEEVRQAKEKLKGATEAEKNAISQNALALGRLGTNYAQVARETKKVAESSQTIKEKTRAMRDALKAGGDESRRLAAGMDFLDQAARNPTAAILGLSAAAAILTVGLGVGLVGAIGAAAIKLDEFVLTAGSALRTQGIDREVAMGAENAKNFGEQIEAMRNRIPATREELNKLAVSQWRLYDATRISGEGILNAWKAVATITTAQGDGGKQIGDKISDILSREKRTGRFGLNSFAPGGADELQGTGLKSINVAKQLAKNLNISLGAAEMQLRMHRVTLSDGAEAIREAIDDRFGAINVKRFYDLDVIAKRLKDSFVGLVAGLDLHKAFEEIDKLSQNFDVAYVNGQALHTILQGLEDILFGPAEKSTGSVIQELIDDAIIGVLKLELEFYEGYGTIKKWSDEFSEWKTYLQQAAIFANQISAGLAMDSDILHGDFAALLVDRKRSQQYNDEADAIIAGRRGRERDRAAARDEAKAVADAEAAATGDTGRYTGPGADAINAAAHDVDQDEFVGAPVVHRAPAHAKGGKVMRPAFGEMFASVAPGETIIPAPQANMGISFPSGGGTTKQLDAQVHVTIALPNVKDAQSFIGELGGSTALADVTRVFEDLFRSIASPTQTPSSESGP